MIDKTINSKEIIDNMIMNKPENGKDVASLLNLSKELSEVLNPDNENFLNIKPDKNENGDLILKNDDGYFILPFGQTNYTLMDSKYFVRFIKKIESLVRTNPEYKRYIAHLKDHGLDHCMILGNLDDDKCSIEMHHGPILNLFDYCTIVLTHQIDNFGSTTSFKVAKAIIEEHLNHNVQVIMLSSSIHQLVEDKNVFINLKQSFGNLERFLEKYKEAITPQQKYVIKEYIKMCETRETDIDNILKAREEVKDWNIGG